MTKPHWSEARAWQTNTALTLVGTGLLLFTRQLVAEYDHFTIGFSGVSGWSATLYVVAVFLILTQPANRYSFRIILSVAIACRLATLFADPFLSSDVYRYVWDGIVQHAHISPYRYVPGDQALTFLRPANQDIFDNINRRDYARTIYPPAAQFLFFLITFISPTLIGMKTFMVLFEGVTLWSVVKLLRHLGRPREQALLYAWCPLLIWEIAGSGHLDSAAMAFIALALLFRIRSQPILTGLALGLAIMIKFYPVVLLPALLLRRDEAARAVNRESRSSRLHALSRFFNISRLDWTMPVTVLGVAIFGYAAYSSAGKLVFGFLGGYVEEEGMSSGSRYFLLELAQHIPGLHNLSTIAYLVLCALIFLALSAWAINTGLADSGTRLEVGLSMSTLPASARFLLPALCLAAALMLLFSPHYPWYIAWLIPFFALVPNLPTLTYIVAMFYLCTTEIATGYGAKQFLLNEYLYGAIAVAVTIQMVLTHYPIQRLHPRRS